MGNMKKYFKKEFRREMFSLEHDDPTDFCLTCWQRNLSSLPLLILRALIFLVCLGILIYSLIGTLKIMSVGMWFIFMTHWGVLLINFASGFACAVSLVAFLKGPLDFGSGLPWYVKTYWALMNMAVSVAFFITIFYWSFLTAEGEDYAVNPVLDIFIHAVNSVVMFILLLVSRHPMRLLHFYLPLGFGIVYMLFSVIFYLADGISPFGTNWIYPMLDWSDPGPTIFMVVILAIVFIVMHAIVVGMAVARDAAFKRCRTTTNLNM